MTAPGQDAARRDFFALTPEAVLAAVESAGLATRPLCYPLNSFENRVYEVELADRQRIVAKFYRPGRWSREQILEEHAFLAELAAEEIPVCGVRPFDDGTTLRRADGLFYALWPRRGGRAPDELSDDAVRRLGMFVGRMHAVGARRPFAHRPLLDVERYVDRPLDFLLDEGLIPRPFRDRYRRAAERVGAIARTMLPGVETLRIHADLHLGNVLFRDGELRVLDFDDAAMGPAVQDLWLALPGRDAESLRQREVLIAGYETFRPFDRASLRLVEPLRALRMVRYCGWLARRRDDPAFRAAWPHFGSDEYWRGETDDLEEQVAWLERAGDARSTEPHSAAVVPRAVEDTELTNADFFWDWQGE